MTISISSNGNQSSQFISSIVSDEVGKNDGRKERPVYKILSDKEHEAVKEKMEYHKKQCGEAKNLEEKQFHRIQYKAVLCAKLASQVTQQYLKIERLKEELDQERRGNERLTEYMGETTADIIQAEEQLKKIQDQNVVLNTSLLLKEADHFQLKKQLEIETARTQKLEEENRAQSEELASTKRKAEELKQELSDARTKMQKIKEAAGGILQLSEVRQ